MAEVKITLKPNGPALIEGQLDITDSAGNKVAVDPAKPVHALCRCGHSERKPFCDGAHNRKGWKETA